jgi:pimeloyl-ACP methyl ester carboxylesterase
MTPRSLLSLLALACLLPAGRTDTFTSNGVRIAYSVQGKGEPAVLIHGWLSSAGLNWWLPGTTGHLARTHKVISIDVRGHGLSDKPKSEDAYGPEAVEDVARLLDHLKIEKAHIVGYSMGGIIAAKFLVKHPNRALSGTLAGAGWLRDGGLEQAAFAAGGKDGTPAGLCFKGLAKLALTEKEIKGIKVPVKLIIGDKDVVKALYVDPLAKVRKDWGVALIKDGDHISCILKPQFREEIAAWLKKNAK